MEAKGPKLELGNGYTDVCMTTMHSNGGGAAVADIGQMSQTSEETTVTGVAMFVLPNIHPFECICRHTEPGYNVVEGSIFQEIPAMNYTYDDTFEEPVAAASDADAFAEMKWLLGAEEPHVRAIAAQVLLGLAATQEGRARIVEPDCLRAIRERIFDAVAGSTVMKLLVKLSMDEGVATALIRARIFVIISKAFRKGEKSYEMAALLANLCRIPGSHTRNIGSIVQAALETTPPQQQQQQQQEREAIDEDEPAAVVAANERHLHMHIALCSACANACSHPLDDEIAASMCEGIHALWPAFMALDAQSSHQQCPQWNYAILFLFWNISFQHKEWDTTDSNALHNFTCGVVHRPNNTRIVEELRRKLDCNVSMRSGALLFWRSLVG